MADDVRASTSPKTGPSRGLTLARASFGLCCAAVVFVLMANDGQVPHAALYGLFLMLGAVLGLLGALGLLTPAADSVVLADTTWAPLPGEPAWMAPRVTVPLALASVVLLPMLLGAAALTPAIVFALLVLLMAALRRPALFVFVAVSALYLPLLGGYGLWDPWETHYGEVSREIL